MPSTTALPAVPANPAVPATPAKPTPIQQLTAYAARACVGACAGVSLMATALVGIWLPELALAPTQKIASRFIVSLKASSETTELTPPNVLSHSGSFEAANVGIKWLRRTSGNAYVLQVIGDYQQTQNTLHALQQHPDVSAIVTDSWVTPAQAARAQDLDFVFFNGALVSGQHIPDDPLFIDQWQLHDDRRQAAAIDTVHAWNITQGSADTVIAVIDTGIRPEHPDLVGRLLPGYDFVSSLDELSPNNTSISSDYFDTRSNDGDGRDNDPTDPGDGLDEATAASLNALNISCAADESSWHGTGVASLIAANANDGIGMAGVDWNAMILPVRAIGRCGGHRSDLLDAIRWAAGVEDPALPLNPTPAHIINLSLGMDDTCSALDQAAINDAVDAGAIVVSAVGNQGRNTTTFPSSPAQCDNVIGVAATDESGHLADYSNFGQDADISAPGGIRFPSLYGITVATNGGVIADNGVQTYKTVSGTSVAAPLVSGTLGLMRSVQPDLNPQQLTQLLLNSAAPFPTDSENRFIEHCDTTKCGEGLLNAHQAVRTAVAYVPALNPENDVLFNDAAPALDAIDNITVGGSGLGCSIRPVNAYSLRHMQQARDPSLLLLIVAAFAVSGSRRIKRRRDSKACNPCIQ